jgi:trehalose 6-phosphate phosphatase
MNHWKNAVSTDLYALIQKPRLGLVTDVDGTLSHIVDTPQDAVITENHRSLLTRLVKYLDLVAALSGRAATDVRDMVGVPGVVYVGNHGMERILNGEVDIPSDVRRFRPTLEEVLSHVNRIDLPGLVVEDKYASVSVHYRQVENQQKIDDSIRPKLKSLCSKHNLKLFEGRMVFEVRPPIWINKGSAFKSLVEEYQLDGAVFIGDDTTDVDALKQARYLRENNICYALGLGVISPETPDSVRDNADLIIDQGVEGVEEFLSWLVRARKASSS